MEVVANRFFFRGDGSWNSPIASRARPRRFAAMPPPFANSPPGSGCRPRCTDDPGLLLHVRQLALPGLLDDLRKRGFACETETAIREWTREHMTVLSFRVVRIDWLKPALPLYHHVLDQARPGDWLGRP